MATSILSAPSDSSTPALDWRLGVVEPEAGHVFGKTALTQQEWRQRAHKMLGHRFVVVYADLQMTRRLGSLPKSFENAQADLGYGAMYRTAAYHPHSGRRMSVMGEDEWQRVLKAGRS